MKHEYVFVRLTETELMRQYWSLPQRTQEEYTYAMPAGE
jgi:hypothetical protein